MNDNETLEWDNAMRFAFIGKYIKKALYETYQLKDVSSIELIAALNNALHVAVTLEVEEFDK